MIEVFMSCTSLAMSEPDTRSSVFAPSSLMLQRRWRRISNVMGSTRIRGRSAAFDRSAFTAIAVLPSWIDVARPRHAEALQGAAVLDLRGLGAAQMQLGGQVEGQLLRTLGLHDPSVLLGHVRVALRE